MAKSFTAQVDEWARATEKRMLAVLQQSAQEVFSIAQTTYLQPGGNLPIDTGFLRNSFTAFSSGSTAMTGPDAYIFAVESAQLGDVIFGGWTADYARRMEYGFVGQDSMGRNYNQKGFGFVQKAAAQWVPIVEANAKRLRSLSA